MRKNFITLLLIVALTIVSVLVVIPNGPNFVRKNLKMPLGLDLQGGVQLIYQIQTDQLDQRAPQEAQVEIVDLINRRVNSLGVSEAQVQSTVLGGDYGILIELPGIKDIEKAKETIGRTAQLKFYEINDQGELSETNLTGADVRKATAGTDQQGASFSGVSPVVYLDFTDEGAKKFEDITGRNVGKQIVTMLDNEVVNQATVNEKIAGGSAVIQGIDDLQAAKETAKLINEGALPAPIELVQETQIGASLGREAIKMSLIAGLVGLLLVAIYMVAYYKYLGLAAVYALAIYTLVVTAIFKLVPVTLTLAGIAGFIFSIGAAVDANILIFERYKEELQKKIPKTQALENGFRRSWPSIRDSNIASLITAIILFYMSTGLVKGFAVTLGIGIVVSMFTAITVTRNLLRFFIKEK